MHDSRGAPLKVGDRVLIEAEITDVQPSDTGYCNVSVRTVTPEQMQGGADSKPPMGPSSLTCNTRWLTKVGACLLLMLSFCMAAFAQDDGAATGDEAGAPKFPRGAIPTAPAKIAAAKAFEPQLQAAEQFAVVPAHLQYWGNDRYGICVTAEEAFAKLAYSKMCGDDEIRVSDSDCIAWARKHGVLNGADLLDVMQMAARDGLAANGKLYTTGVPQRVNWRDESELRAAISTGPVKIGIQAGDLPSGAGNKNGWWAIRSVPGGREDHAVALCGYGPASYLYGELGLPVPSGLTADKQGYLLFTWSTIGFVSHEFIMGSVDEAWVRVPTTVGETPKPPDPPTPPTPPTPPDPPSPDPQPWWMTLLHWLIPLVMGGGVVGGGMHLWHRQKAK